MKTLNDRFFEKVVIRESGCHEWIAGCSANGYGAFQKDGASHGAHRVAYEIAFGQIPDGLCVCHTCDNPRCCNPAHLFLGTDKDNATDRTAKGRDAHGERNGVAKLTNERVLEIFRADGTQEEIAAEYGVCQQQVCKIKRRVAWRHVTKEAA